MSDGYLVARVDTTIFIRAIGLANMKNTPLLDAFMSSELEQGAVTACLDLSACRGMDSTFMGTLVGYHHRFQLAGGNLVVVNPSPGNKRLLDMLGVSAVLPVVQGQPLDLHFVNLESRQAVTPLQRAQMMKSAHQHLIKLSPDNRSKFGPFLEALDKDLKRLESE